MINLSHSGNEGYIQMRILANPKYIIKKFGGNGGSNSALIVSNLCSIAAESWLQCREQLAIISSPTSIQ